MGRKRTNDKIIPSDFVVTHHGTDAVTGTCITVEIPDENLYIAFDMGFFQDSTVDAKTTMQINARKAIDVGIDRLTHVLVSHAHLDHVGGLGLLMLPELGFKGHIMCTEACQPLTMLNVRDCAFVMQQTCKMYNKANPNKTPLLPLYLDSHANELILHLRGYRYYEEVPLSQNVTATFYPTGHLLGDSSILLTYKKDEYTTRKLFYTGDTNAYTTDPKPFTKQWDENEIDPDVVIMENTYSGRFHEKRNTLEELEAHVLEHVLAHRGILFIPAFAISRSTQMVYYLKKIWDRNPKLQKANIPIYLAGNLMNASHNVFGNDYYRQHYMDECWMESDCFKWGNVKKITNFPEIDEQLLDNKPKIIIASSGMITGGYSTYIAQNLIGRPNTMLLFCGYQGAGTHGRAILDTMNKDKKTVNIQGKSYKVSCVLPKPLQVSGHADEGQLIKLVKSCNQGKLKHIILIHGDQEGKSHMKERLEQVLDMDKKTIHIPQVGETMRLFNSNKR